MFSITKTCNPTRPTASFPQTTSHYLLNDIVQSFSLMTLTMTYADGVLCNFMRLVPSFSIFVFG